MAKPTLNDANTYHQERLNTVWEGLDTAEREAAILLAADYIQLAYNWVEDYDEDNALVQEAIIMLAPERAKAQSLASSQQVLETEQSMEGVGSTRTKFADKSGDPYPLVTAKLKSLAKRPNGARQGRLTL